MLMNWKTKFCKTGKSPQTKQQNQCNPDENPNGILVDLDKHSKREDTLEKRGGS